MVAILTAVKFINAGISLYSVLINGVTDQTRMALGREHTSAKAQQSPLIQSSQILKKKDLTL